MTGRVSWCLAFVAGAILSAHGCSLVVDFDDQCATTLDCRDISPQLVCRERLCVERPALDSIETDGCRLLGLGEADIAENSDKTIILGALLPRSGSLGASGPDMENAVSLALGEMNFNGGIGGRKIGVLSCDTGTNPVQAKEQAAILAGETGVPAILGAASSTVTTEAFTQVAHPAGVLMISPASTAPGLTYLDDDDLLWRTATSDAVQGRALAYYLDHQGLSHIALVHRDDTYGQGLAQVIHDTYCSIGHLCATGEDWLQRSYSVADESDGSWDFSDFVVDGELVSKKTGERFDADAVVIIGYPPDAAQFLTSLAGHPDALFVSADALKTPGLGETHGLTAGILCRLVGTGPAGPAQDDPVFAGFVDRYYALWGDAHVPDAFAASTYDATYLLGYAVASAQSRGAYYPVGSDLALGLKRTSEGEVTRAGGLLWPGAVHLLTSDPKAGIDFQGASGPLDFDNSTGEAPGAIEAWRYDPDADEPKPIGILMTADEQVQLLPAFVHPEGSTCVLTR